MGRFRGTTACPKRSLSCSMTTPKSVRSRSRWLTTIKCGMSSFSPRRQTRSVTTWIGSWAWTTRMAQSAALWATKASPMKPPSPGVSSTLTWRPFHSRRATPIPRVMPRSFSSSELSRVPVAAPSLPEAMPIMPSAIRVFPVPLCPIRHTLRIVCVSAATIPPSERLRLPIRPHGWAPSLTQHHPPRRSSDRRVLQSLPRMESPLFAAVSGRERPATRLARAGAGSVLALVLAGLLAEVVNHEEASAGIDYGLSLLALLGATGCIVSLTGRLASGPDPPPWGRGSHRPRGRHPTPPRQRITSDAAILEGTFRSPLQPHGLRAPDIPRLGRPVVALHRDANRRRAHVPLPAHHQAGQEHAQGAGAQAGDGRASPEAQGRPGETPAGDDEALRRARGEPAEWLSADLRPDPHLPRPLLHHNGVREAGEFQDRRPALVPGPHRGGPVLRPARALHRHDDDLAGDSDEEHRPGAEKDYALPAARVRGGARRRRVPGRPLRLLGGLERHQHRPEPHHLPRRPEAKSRTRRIATGRRGESRGRWLPRQRRSGNARAGPERSQEDEDEKEAVDRGRATTQLVTKTRASADCRP